MKTGIQISAQSAPMANNFMTGKMQNDQAHSESETSKASGAQKSETSAHFAAIEEKTFEPKKSRFEGSGLIEGDSKESAGAFDHEISAPEENKIKQSHFTVQESIKEVDESENQDLETQQLNSMHKSSEMMTPSKRANSNEFEEPAKARKLNHVEKDFIKDQVNEIWSKYDVDDSGVLDKIETANFLNEILTAQGQGPPTMEQFNMFFAEFDTNHDGVIQKGEMARFIKRFIYGSTSFGESSSLI